MKPVAYNALLDAIRSWQNAHDPLSDAEVADALRDIANDMVGTDETEWERRAQEQAARNESLRVARIALRERIDKALAN